MLCVELQDEDTYDEDDDVYLNRQSTFIQLFKSTFIIKGVSEQYILSSPSSAEVLPPDQAHNGLPSVLEPR